MRGGEGRGRLFNLAKMVVALLKEVEFKVEKAHVCSRGSKINPNFQQVIIPPQFSANEPVQFMFSPLLYSWLFTV